MTMSLDKELFLFIQGFTGNPVLDSIMLFLAEVLVFLVPLTLIYLWFRSCHAREDALFTFISTVAGISLTYALGIFYFHNQPFATYDTIVAGGELDNAFPSQHTATMFSVFWSFLYLERRRLAAVFGIAGVMTGIGRVFVGHHYPVDILGGVLSGLLGLGLAVLLEELFGDEIDLVLDKVEEAVSMFERRSRYL